MKNSLAKNSLAMTSALLLSAAQIITAAHADGSATASTQTKKAAEGKSAAASESPHQAGRPLLKTRPVGDAAIMRTEADAMGFIRFMGPAETNKVLNRIQWGGAGKMTEGGTTYAVTKYTYTVSLHLKAAREDIQRKAAGPKAVSKTERLVTVVLDQDAWDEKTPGVDGRKAKESALNRRLKLARTPIGFTRAMLDADQSTVKVVDSGPGGKVTISLPIEGVLTTAELNADYRPDTITMKVDGKTIVATDRGYKDISEYGVMFPTHMTETIDGHPYLDLTINDARVASYAAFPKPDFLKAH